MSTVKISILIKILSGGSCLGAISLFVWCAYLDISTNSRDNGGIMSIALILFFVFFITYNIIPDDNNVDSKEFPIPVNGRLIRITWLKHCRNVSSNIPNPYIGMVGRVRNLKPDGSFELQCETCWLIVTTEYKFEYLD